MRVEQLHTWKRGLGNPSCMSQVGIDGIQMVKWDNRNRAFQVIWLPLVIYQSEVREGDCYRTLSCFPVVWLPFRDDQSYFPLLLLHKLYFFSYTNTFLKHKDSSHPHMQIFLNIFKVVQETILCFHCDAEQEYCFHDVYHLSVLLNFVISEKLSTVSIFSVNFKQ